MSENSDSGREWLLSSDPGNRLHIQRANENLVSVNFPPLSLIRLTEAVSLVCVVYCQRLLNSKE